MNLQHLYSIGIFIAIIVIGEKNMDEEFKLELNDLNSEPEDDFEPSTMFNLKSGDNKIYPNCEFCSNGRIEILWFDNKKPVITARCIGCGRLQEFILNKKLFDSSPEGEELNSEIRTKSVGYVS